LERTIKALRNGGMEEKMYLIPERTEEPYGGGAITSRGGRSTDGGKGVHKRFGGPARPRRDRMKKKEWMRTHTVASGRGREEVGGAQR